MSVNDGLSPALQKDIRARINAILDKAFAGGGKGIFISLVMLDDRETQTYSVAGGRVLPREVVRWSLQVAADLVREMDRKTSGQTCEGKDVVWQ